MCFYVTAVSRSSSWFIHDSFTKQKQTVKYDFLFFYYSNYNKKKKKIRILPPSLL